MFRILRFATAFLFVLALNASAETVTPPVNLNKPIENPALVRAIDRVAKENSDAVRNQLQRELQHANYLAAVLQDGDKSAGLKAGKTTLKKGTRLNVLTAQKAGKHYLVLFTDWQALKAYTTLEVTGWVLPARDAWSFALKDAAFDGVVINPAHNALPLDRPMLESLSKTQRSKPAR